MATIYLDMDGVVSDFDAYAEPIVGFRTPGGVRYDQEGWEKISAEPRLYSKLELCPGANQLVTTVQEIAEEFGYDVKFLTAIPRQNDVPWTFHDKTEWINARWPGIPVFFGPYSHDKHQHCRPGDILIDDRPSNIDEWNSAGGHGILHVDYNVKETLIKLYSLV